MMRKSVKEFSSESLLDVEKTILDVLTGEFHLPGDFPGTVKLTIEYIPSKEEQKYFLMLRGERQIGCIPERQLAGIQDYDDVTLKEITKEHFIELCKKHGIDYESGEEED